MAKKTRTPPPPRVQAPQRRDPKRPSSSAPRTSGLAALTTGNRRWIALGAVVAVAVAAALIGFFATRGSSGSPSGLKVVDFNGLAGLQTGPAPWDNGTAFLPDRLAAIGLDQLGAEGQVLHIHQHLDVYVNGKKVVVPALIGIYANSWLTELHTHDPSGVIHLESPVNKDYSLSQFFGAWGVKLTQDCIGRYCGAKKFHWWLNGKPQTSDPGALVLAAHEEIAIAYGTPPLVVPKSYKFPAGE